MDDLWSSLSPHPISTFVGNRAAPLPSEHTELSSELSVVPAGEGQPGILRPSGVTRWWGGREKLRYSYRTELRGDLRQLPLELCDMIMTYVLLTYENEDDDGGSLDGGRHRRGRERLSRLSLVCRNWSHILRPRLFKYLSLRSRSDIRFLDSMLRRPQNGWLSAAVVRLQLYQMSDCNIVGLERVLLMLSRKLPSLQELYHRPTSQKTESLSLCLLHSLPCYCSLRTLELRNIKVSSFGLLVKILGSIPQLADLICSNVNWIHQDPVERPPTRMAPFLHLSDIDVSDECSSPWKFLWLFHPMILRRCAPSSTNVESHDIVLMVMLIKVVSNMSRDNPLCSLTLSYDSGQDELSVHDPLYDSVQTFQLWPVAPATLNNISSVLRRVEVTLDWDRYSAGDGAKWKAVDTALAQKAVSIEAFSVGIEVGFKRTSIETLLSFDRSHFPRLIARGVVRMRTESHGEIRHDWRPVHPAHDSGSESMSDDSDDASDSSDPNIWDDSDSPDD